MAETKTDKCNELFKLISTQEAEEISQKIYYSLTPNPFSSSITRAMERNGVDPEKALSSLELLFASNELTQKNFVDDLIDEMSELFPEISFQSPERSKQALDQLGLSGRFEDYTQVKSEWDNIVTNPETREQLASFLREQLRAVVNHQKSSYEYGENYTRVFAKDIFESLDSGITSVDSVHETTNFISRMLESLKKLFTRSGSIVILIYGGYQIILAI